MHARKRFNLALLTTIAAGAMALIGASGAMAGAKGFSYGVSSGDVTSNSAILWAKANKGGKTYLQVKSNGSFGGCDANRAVAKVKAKKNRRLHGPGAGREARSSDRVQVPLLQQGRRAQRHGHVHDRARRQVEPDDPLRALRRPGRAPDTRRNDPVLEQLRDLEADPQAGQRLQRDDGRHDLLRHRGAGVRAQRRRAVGEAEVGGLQDQPGDEAVDEGPRRSGLLRALGRPRVRQRLLARGELVPALGRRRRT